MYRELGQAGVVFGLRAGPYAGGPRTLGRDEVPAHVARRLVRAIAGQGRAAPLLARPAPGRWASHFNLASLAGVLTGGLLPMALRDLGSDRHGLVQGPERAVLYAVGLSVAAVLWWRLVESMRRPWPRPGLYLLPLDVVEVGPGSLTVTPLGGVRRVAIEDDREGLALTLTFAHGARYAFPVAGEREAEAAHERLEQSQAALESLTEATDLERALDLDPFFTLRGTSPLAPGGGAPAEPHLRVVASIGLVAALGAGAGVGLWKIRNLASDQLFFDRMAAENTPGSYERYLRSGALRRPQALAALARLHRQRQLDDDNRRFHEEEARPAPPADPCRPPRPDAAVDEALACYRPHSLGVRPAVRDLIAQRVRQRRPLTVAFGDRLDRPHAARSPCGAACRHETLVLDALRLAFSEVFAPSTLALDEVTTGAPDLLIDARRAGPSDLGTCTFDVTLRSASAPVTFRLTMPPPREPLTAVRDRSLFTLDPGDSEPLAVQALSARAHDRLYDELFSLFFDGDPRVALRPSSPGPGSPRR